MKDANIIHYQTCNYDQVYLHLVFLRLLYNTLAFLYTLPKYNTFFDNKWVGVIVFIPWTKTSLCAILSQRQFPEGISEQIPDIFFLRCEYTLGCVYIKLNVYVQGASPFQIVVTFF